VACASFLSDVFLLSSRISPEPVKGFFLISLTFLSSSLGALGLES
jgi:hypothetical protein